MKTWLWVCVLVWLSVDVFAQTEPCKPQRHIVNRANNGDDIIINTTTPTQVIVPSSSRCEILLLNKGANPMRCMPTDQGVPSNTKGLEFVSNKQLLMTTAGRQAWQCIASSGSATTVTTIEEEP